MKISVFVGGLAMAFALSACGGGNNTTLIDVPVSEGAYQMLCGQIAQASDPVKARYGCQDI
jgi:hypothetical protein